MLAGLVANKCLTKTEAAAITLKVEVVVYDYRVDASILMPDFNKQEKR